MGVDVNEKNDCGYTAIYYSSQNYEILELLISFGADVNSASDNGTTALMKAFQPMKAFQGWNSSHTDARSCVRLLLENGANPNAVCEFGWNALMRALHYRYGKVSDVKLLLDYNMDMEGLFESVDGYVSLLYYAFDTANFEVAELLVEYGIDMTKQDWLLDTEHLPKGLRGNDHVYNKLLALYRNPADLKVLVCNNLRRLLGRSIRVASTQLGLPKALENFIIYK